MSKILFLLLIITVAPCFSSGVITKEIFISTYSTEKVDFDLYRIIKGLEHPWSFVFLPDNSVLITERKGKLFHLQKGILVEISGLPYIPAKGQGGLLDIIIHPDFEYNKLIYFSHSALIGSGTGTGTGTGTAVSRAVFDGERLNGIERIFTSNKGYESTHHYGSRIVFGRDGKLFITLGERGSSFSAQDTFDHAGSVVRVNDDGSIPDDNPFISSGGAPEIYTYGHRNPQGIAVDPLTGSVWLNEHGPKGGDEINKINIGANYGWPIVTYGINYNGSVISRETEASGIESPLLYWVPSIAPSGMTFYTGNNFEPWKNDIFTGALSGKHIRRIIRNGEKITGEEILLKDAVGRVRDIRTGPDGNLWFITDEKDGGLYKLQPKK